MAITINGNGTVTGISVGGLPDGIVDTDTLANNAVQTAKLHDDALTAAKMPSGTSLQTVIGVCSTSDVNITSDSWANTGHTATITTLAANSKILVELTGGGWHDSGSGTTTAFITFERNFDGGTYVYPTGAADGAHGLMRMSGDGENWNIGPYSCTLLDAPAQAVGTVIIYRVLVKKTNASGNTQYQASDRGLPTLTLTEVAV